MSVKNIFLASIFCLTSACASGVSNFKIGVSGNEKSFAPVEEKDVTILYKQKPPEEVQEFAVVNYNGGDGRAETWYKKIRTEAAMCGAHYVYDLKLTSKLVQQCSTSCQPKGGCATTCSDVPVFNLAGTMGRKK